MDKLIISIRQIITESQASAVRSVNHALTLMYWQIGRVIVEEQQQGNERADYGKALIKNLSAQLVADYGEKSVKSESSVGPPALPDVSNSERTEFTIELDPL